MGAGETVVAVVAVVLGLLIPLSAILFPVLLIWGLVWLCRGGRCRTNPQQQRQEAELMQQIHLGLSKLDQRVEALETLLLDTKAPGCDNLSAAGKDR